MGKTAVLGMLTGFALILSYVEAAIPFMPQIPGVKLGLANLAAVLCLYLYGGREAFLVNLARVLLVSVLFGNLYTAGYSLAGALFSFAAMAVAKRAHCFSVVGVSVCGGVFHNVGQLFMAVAVTMTIQVVYYLPWLLVSGCITGLLIGILAGEVLAHVRISQGKGSRGSRG